MLLLVFACTSEQLDASSFYFPSFRQHPLNFLWAALVVGAISAGAIQWAKDGLGWRHNFQRDMVRAWVSERAEAVKDDVKSALAEAAELPEVDNKLIGYTATEQLEKLITGGDSKYTYVAAYSLPLEQLFGQLSAAAEISIATPQQYPLFAVFAGVGSALRAEEYGGYARYVRKRREIVREMAQSHSIPKAMQSGGDVTQGIPFSSGDAPQGVPFAGSDTDRELTPEEQHYADVRVRLLALAHRALDHLQITIGERWRKELVLASIASSLIITSLILIFLRDVTAPLSVVTRIGVTTLALVALTVSGALAASFIHDSKRALRSSRR